MLKLRDGLSLEKVNMGFWLLDCAECGTVGVWEKRDWAKAAGVLHVCPSDLDHDV